MSKTIGLSSVQGPVSQNQGESPLAVLQGKKCTLSCTEMVWLAMS